MLLYLERQWGRVSVKSFAGRDTVTFDHQPTILRCYLLVGDKSRRLPTYKE